ncbi:hypothetical protein SAMN03080617_00450 [Algoriphagus alkaliphilus]|uniref:Uncharacterized protein n=1 Tax=Algoriphagus alkaliphilus TaxID=279824 RepID=A0A1G5VFA9_9BACT|nr:hypothetical protein [Algoriphagus alkaliphilus]SDA43735.1 hypothetical protein SAMN03080617_00450 [Algoriphagus alkaliphilus]
MKYLIFPLTIFLLTCSLACVPEEEELFYESCEGFDFTIPARDWMLLVPGVNYTIQSGEKTRKVISDYTITEPFTIESNPVLVQQGERQCYGLYQSYYRTEDGWATFSNKVGYGKTSGLGFMDIYFQQMGFRLDIVNETLVGKRINPTVDDSEEYLYENFPSLVIDGKQFNNVFKISQFNPKNQPQEIYLVKRLGLVAFTMRDSLWIVGWTP